MKRFEKRTVIVTGGARGMGASHARGFVAEGANVVIADVLEQEGRTLADELGDQAIFSRLDVTSDTDWAATVLSMRKAGGAGARARQHPRQLHPPRPHPHADDGGAGRRGGRSGGGKAFGDSARRRA